MFKFKVKVEVWEHDADGVTEPDETPTLEVWARDSTDAESKAERKAANAYPDACLIIPQTPEALQIA